MSSDQPAKSRGRPKKAVAEETKAAPDLPLRERLMAKISDSSGDMKKAKQALFGSSGSQTNQQLAGRKRMANETDMFKELNAMADTFNSLDEANAMPTAAKDMTKRRKYAEYDPKTIDSQVAKP